MKKIRKFSAVIISAFLIIFIFTGAAVAADYDEVMLGGMPFGVRFKSGIITVGETCTVDTAGGEKSPAESAGIMKDDIILKIDGNTALNVTDIIEKVEKSNGKKIDITVERNGKELTYSLKPEKSESIGKYRIGLLLKEGMSGIGTVTYIIPETNAFGGLGHGICDSTTGKLCKIDVGKVSPVTVTDVVKGTAGVPGVLHGAFDEKVCGTADKNAETGVYGKFFDNEAFRGEIIEVGESSSVHKGDAKIFCTVSDAGITEYDVKITPTGSDGCESFVIEVTDDELISKTGGIVQGMSGSPVVQDGKIIGAVTHVLISDPTRGYGIFIEKMLDAMPE